MTYKNYYKVLGIKRTASTKEIKERFVKIIKILDPNKNADNPKVQEKYREVIEAYKVLGNLERRLKYAQIFHTNKSFQDRLAVKDYEYRKENKIKM